MFPPPYMCDIIVRASLQFYICVFFFIEVYPTARDALTQHQRHKNALVFFVGKLFNAPPLYIPSSFAS